MQIKRSKNQTEYRFGDAVTFITFKDKRHKFDDRKPPKVASVIFLEGIGWKALWVERNSLRNILREYRSQHCSQHGS